MRSLIGSCRFVNNPRPTITLLTMVALLLSTQVRADFQDGMAAYQAGEYARAFVEWQRLAEQGEARAQLALAGMYLNGHGVEQDDFEAARWTRAAAEQNLVSAQYALGLMYKYGRGVNKDLVHAYLWLSLAEANAKGDTRLEFTRSVEAVSRNMTKEQLAEANRLLAERNEDLQE